MSKQRVLRLVGIASLVFLVFVFVGSLFVFNQIHVDGDRTAQMRFVINEGDGVTQVAQQLKDQGAISLPSLFIFAAWVQGRTADIQAGEYVIPADASIDKILSLFVDGQVENVMQIKIPEESTNEEIAQYLDDLAVVSRRDFLEVANTEDVATLFPSEVQFPILADKPAGAGLEGYLYPDTYEIYKDATAEDIIFKLITNLERKVSQEDRDAIAAQGKTFFEILTMASIVEKEEPNKDEKSTVAGVFWNRISLGMPLQSDATVNYVTDADNPQPTLQELQTESAYNTYLNRGLPPGPIANPTIESIRAAIYPADTEYVYFLHPQDGSGRTIYARTADEHAQNKATYLD